MLRLVQSPAAIVQGLAATCVDVAVLGGLAAITMSAVDGQTRWPRLAGQALWIGIVFVYGSMVFWHAYYQDIGAAYEFTPLGLSAGIVLFFAAEMVPTEGWLLFAGFWVLVLSSWWWAWLDHSRLPTSPGGRPLVRVTGGALLVAVGAGIAAIPGVQHPLAALIIDASSGTNPVIRAGGETLDIDHLDLRRTDSWPVESRFLRVLVFIMEGVSRAEFDEAISAFPSGGFFGDVAGFATKYNGFFTVNQESRTARTAMMHSLLIPWEAYVAEWTDLYGHIYEHGGMVGLLNANGWKTTVAIPLIDMPWDLRGLPWGNRVTISEADFARPGFTCLAPTAYDRGCEDSILLDRIEALLAEPGPSFLFQPFLFGHTSKWEEATGIDRIAYYDLYLYSVLELLRRSDGLDETLIIVTSDHGPRQYRALFDVDSYEVPLWFVHPSFPAEVRSGHFANTEFRDLVLESMRDGEPPAARTRRWLMAMGPTTRSLFACIGQDGTFAFLKSLGRDRASVVEASPADASFWKPCVTTFHRYRQDFANGSGR